MIRLLLIGLVVLGGCSKKIMKQEIALDTAIAKTETVRSVGSGVAGKYANGDKPITPIIQKEDKRYTVYFGFDSYDITPETDLTIAEIQGMAEIGSIVITGNTCPIGTDEYNKALGMRRARAVAVALGRDCKCTSNGESRLVATESSEYALNRRCEIEVNYQKKIP